MPKRLCRDRRWAIKGRFDVEVSIFIPDVCSFLSDSIGILTSSDELSAGKRLHSALNTETELMVQKLSLRV